MHTLKVLNGWSLHELDDHSNQIVDVGLGDSQVYEALDNLLELFLVVGHSGVMMQV